jgi:hypothetical protein
VSSRSWRKSTIVAILILGHWKDRSPFAIHAAHLACGPRPPLIEGCNISICYGKNCGEEHREVCLGAVATNQCASTMEVLAITIFLSLCLAGFFVVMFLGSGQCSRHSQEQDALMPLDDDPPGPAIPISSKADDHS